ncbi:MAG: HAD family hydrolase [Gammaproteobacteria bacterium]
MFIRNYNHALRTYTSFDRCDTLCPGVERLINEARERRYRLAIATTTTPENITALLTHTLGEESINWFEVIAAGDIVPAKNRHPTSTTTR